MRALDRIHETFVYGRRIRRLCEFLCQLIPLNCVFLDVGCGDGRLAESLLQKRPDLRIEGVDVLVREQTRLPIKAFDGATLPYPDASFDGVMMIDVLHHTENPVELLREAIRVSRRWLIVKDHVLQGFMSGRRLQFMDRIGNARHSVALPYNYLPAAEWSEIQGLLNLKVRSEIRRLGLYPWPFDYVFGASLHFISLMERLTPPDPA